MRITMLIAVKAFVPLVELLLMRRNQPLNPLTSLLLFLDILILVFSLLNVLLISYAILVLEA
jgi:hypothetical protein